MPSLPPELAVPFEQLRVKLLEINGSEQTCMTDVVAGASQGQSLPEVQAIMSRCRKSSAAAANAAIDTFRTECSPTRRRATSMADAAVVDATTTNVSRFWANEESATSAFASEAAALLPAQGPDETIQSIKNHCGERVSRINRYFEQLTT